MKQTLLVLGVSAALASPALAQDPVKVEPNHYKVVAENERVRVLKVTVPKGDKSQMHEHPDHFVVFLTDVNVEFGLPDGTTTPPRAVKAGGALENKAGKHHPKNLGGPVEGFLVEVKSGAAAPAPVAGAVPPPSGGDLTRTQLVSSDRGEVVSLKTPAGFEEPAGSKHEYDAVVVPITDGGAELTLGGKTVTMKRGEAYLIPRGAEHGVKSVKAGETIVVYVK
jgi:beta-alanine degradation protein BauB